MSISVAQFQLFSLAFTRIMAILIQVPVLGGRTIPNQVKIAFGVVLAAIMLPWQPLPAGAPPLSLLEMGGGLLRELIIGLMAGFASMLTFSAVQIAGEQMGISAGFAAERIINPTFESSGSAVDQIFIVTATLLFFILNGHHLVLIGLQQTFQVLPLNSALPEPSATRVLMLTGQLIGAGILLAVPVIGAALLADVTLGLLSRVAPQVQVFFLGVPLKVLMGLAVVMLTLAVIFPTLGDLLRAIGPRMVALLGG